MFKIDPIKFQEYSTNVAAINGYQGGGVCKGIDKINLPKEGIPFGQLTAGGNVGIAPVEAKDNYDKGLKFSNDLKGAYLGQYKGKDNYVENSWIA